MSHLERNQTASSSMQSVWAARSNEFWKAEFGAAAAAGKGNNKKRTSQPPEPLRREIRDILLDYARNAYIACAGLASRGNIPLWDRALWSLVILGSAIYTGMILHRTYFEYSTNPLQIAMVTSNLDLGRFPFPSVTICPRSRIRKSVAMDIIMRRNNLTSLDETVVLPALRLMQSLKDRHWITFERPGKLTEQAVQLFDNISWYSFMREVLPPCHDIFRDCYWASVAFDCCDYFLTQKTRCGFCYAFNSLISFYNFEQCTSTGVDPNARDSLWYEQRPSTRDCELFRTSGVGPSSALEVYFKVQNPSEKLGNRSADLGFDLIVSSPKDFPEWDAQRYVPETPGLMTYASVQYSETSVVSTVRQVPPHKRGCYFEDDAESPLSSSGYWYSESSCKQLFFRRFFSEKCGCSPYFSFSAPDASSCDLRGHECLLRESLKLFGYNSTDCPALCGGTSYKARFAAEPSIYDHTRNTSGAINVFYGDRRSVIKYRQQLRMDGFDQLIAYGGLLSLLLGLSFVSLAQPLFYLCQVAAALLWPRGLPRLRLRRRQLCCIQGRCKTRRVGRGAAV